MKHVDAKQLLEAVPLAPSLKTRKEKLLYLADLVRKTELGVVSLYHKVETWTPKYLKEFRITDDCSVFGIALADPVLKEAGLVNTVTSHMDFFEVSQQELHIYSCDCGGSISTSEAANLITKLANKVNPPAAKPSNIFKRTMARFG